MTTEGTFPPCFPALTVWPSARHHCGDGRVNVATIAYSLRAWAGQCGSRLQTFRAVLAEVVVANRTLLWFDERAVGFRLGVVNHGFGRLGN